MEPVSLSVSVVALATIFDSALNCFKHVKVAKSFGSDYQTYVLRLQNLQLRLSRWGETVGLGKDLTAGGQSMVGALPDSQLKQAEELVGHIIRLFSDAEELADKYAGSAGDLVVIEEDAQGLGGTAKLCQKMRDICLRRQRQTNAAKKTKWSLFSREKFIELVDNIQKLIDDLESVFPAETRISKEQNLCEQEASELREEKALPELQKITLKQDALLAEAIAKLAHNVRTSAPATLCRSLQDRSVLPNRRRSPTTCMTNPKSSIRRRFRTSLAARASPSASR
jgi:hypothetical protein